MPGTAKQFGAHINLCVNNRPGVFAYTLDNYYPNVVKIANKHQTECVAPNLSCNRVVTELHTLGLQTSFPGFCPVQSGVVCVCCGYKCRILIAHFVQSKAISALYALIRTANTTAHTLLLHHANSLLEPHHTNTSAAPRSPA